jgi:hypothetical protein
MADGRQDCFSRGVLILGVAAMFSLTGCGRGGAKTYPVKGRIALESGEVQLLSGSHVEAALVSDPFVIAAGEIKPDGTFALETLRAGEIQKGAPPGDYKVRIIPTEDNPEAARKLSKVMDSSARRFESSGLTLQVPAKGEITLNLPTIAKGENGTSRLGLANASR